MASPLCSSLPPCASAEVPGRDPVPPGGWRLHHLVVVNRLGDFSAFIFSLTLFCTVGIIDNEVALFIYYESINAADDIFHHC